MSLTIERPETEARLIRFATARGLSPLDALDELLDEVEEEDYKLTPDDIEALKQGAADSDAGRVSDGPTNMARRFEKLKQRAASAGTQERAA